jgi:hypothetical protein
MATLPIKILKDEQKQPFIPFTNIDGVYIDSETTLREVLAAKLEADDIKAGDNITLVKDGNEITINASGGSQVNLIDNLNTTTPGQGALDAHQGNVLKGMIPNVVDDVTSTSTTAALSANQGYVLNNLINEKQDKNFYFTQTTASDTWVITHNLNKYPSATVIDSAGTEVVGNITYNSLNQITITFSGAFKGSATLN